MKRSLPASLGILLCAATANAGLIYGLFHNTSSSSLAMVDPSSGLVTPIGDTQVSLQSLAYNPVTSSLYGTDGATLYQLDPYTAQATPVATFSIPNAVAVPLGKGSESDHSAGITASVTSFAFDSAGQTLGSVLYSDNLTAQLITFDPANAEVALRNHPAGSGSSASHVTGGGSYYYYATAPGDYSVGTYDYDGNQLDLRPTVNTYLSGFNEPLTDLTSTYLQNPYGLNLGSASGSGSRSEFDRFVPDLFALTTGGAAISLLQPYDFSSKASGSGSASHQGPVYIVNPVPLFLDNPAGSIPGPGVNLDAITYTTISVIPEPLAMASGTALATLFMFLRRPR